jgi:hypothetical protein
VSDRRRSSPPARTRRSPAQVDLSPRNQRRRTVGARVRRRSGIAVAPRRDAGARHPVLAAAGSWTRPGLRLLLLCAEVSAAILLMASPAFAAHQLDVTGVHHLSRDDVLRRTGLGSGGSVFLVTPETAERILLSDPYVRAVTVRASLPDRVEVSVDEWEPKALVHRGGHDYLVSPEGTVLGPGLGVTVGSGPGQPKVEVQWSATGSLRTGDHVISGRLLQDLQNIVAAFPAAYGLNVTALDLAADQQLVAETREGPRILFGQMVTEEQVDSLDAKLASLKALSGRVDLSHSKLDYINLMNQYQPVTHTIPSPSPSPSAKPKKP